MRKPPLAQVGGTPSVLRSRCYVIWQPSVAFNSQLVPTYLPTDFQFQRAALATRLGTDTGPDAMSPTRGLAFPVG